MVKDHIRKTGEIGRAQGNLITLFHVGSDDLPLGVCQLAGLVQDLQRNTDLADIMQQCQQGQIAHLHGGQLQTGCQTFAQPLRAQHMGLGVAIAFLQCPQKGGQRIVMNGILIHQLAVVQGPVSLLDAVENAGVLRIHHAGGVFNSVGEFLPQGGQLRFYIGFLHVIAQHDQVGILTADVIGTLLKMAAEQISQIFQHLITGIVTFCAVDQSQTGHVADADHDGVALLLQIFYDKAPESVPVVIAGQQVGLHLRVGKHE